MKLVLKARNPYHNGLCDGFNDSLAFSVLAEHHTSLMHGWLPGTVQAVAVTALLLAVGWRSRGWRLMWLPAAAAVGAGVAAWAHWYITADGLADDPAPRLLWWWIAFSGAAIAILVLGWPSAAWWRRGASLLAVPLCLLSTGLVLNLWVGTRWEANWSKMPPVCLRRR